MFQKQDSALLPPDAALVALRGSGAPALSAKLDGRHAPPSLGALFPGLDLRRSTRTNRATYLILLESPAAARHPGPALRIAPGLLETPRFRPGLPWISATVAGGRAADGTRLRGAMDLARDTPDAALHHSAGVAAERIVRGRLGGQSWSDAPPDRLLAHPGPGLTIVAASFDETASRAMLAHVLDRTGAAHTLVFIPEAVHLPLLRADAARAGCRVAQGPLDPWPLLDATAELHVADDCALALLASFAGKQVHCHGEVWFSGHVSATGDTVVPQANLAAAALLIGATYADPFTQRACTPEHAIDLAADWRRVCDANRRVAACVGMQFWKRRRISQFLHTGVRPPAFRRGAAPAIAAAREASGAIAVWASRTPPGLAARAAAAHIPVLRVEDGFLRSVGLGSDFNLPCSIVLDGSGLYYDPSQPSDLEQLLATSDFGPALIARTRALVDRLVQAGLTKYNTGAATLPAIPTDGRPVILVTGQVADDLSVRLGGGEVTSNADLLRRVRAANPDAYIVYKSHPDVDAGHRPGAIPDAEALVHADALARGAPMGALIGAVDELHTMTSLAGFEALLRGRRVVAWGRPFYAGWGLTQDMAAIPRRTRQLTLEELAAGVLLLYPRYLDPVTGLPCPPEVLLDRLANPALWQPGLLVRARRIQGRLRAAINGLSRTSQPERT